LTTHVDDFKVVGKETDARIVLGAIKARLEIKDLDPIKQYLRTTIDINNNGIKITQSRYKNDLLKSLGIADAHATRYPLDPGILIDDQPDPNVSIKEYQRGTGSLQYLAAKSRPDVCWHAGLPATVGVVLRFLTSGIGNPRDLP
jgi:hypothetical protein